MRLYLLPLIGRGSSLTNTKGVHRTPLCMDRINRLVSTKIFEFSITLNVHYSNKCVLYAREWIPKKYDHNKL